MIFNIVLSWGQMTPRFFFYILLLSIIFLYGIFRLRKKNSEIKRLLLLILITILSELISRFLKSYIGKSHPIYHILIPVLIIVHHHFTIPYILPKKRIYLTFLTYLVITFSMIFSIRDGLHYFPSKQYALLSLYTISSALFYYLKTLKKPTTEFIWNQPIFWFFTGNLVFYSFTFFVFGFYTSLKSINIETPQWLYSIIFFANLILYPCYFMCLYKTPKTTTS